MKAGLQPSSTHFKIHSDDVSYCYSLVHYDDFMWFHDRWINGRPMNTNDTHKIMKRFHYVSLYQWIYSFLPDLSGESTDLHGKTPRGGCQVGTVIGMLRSLGVRISEKQLLELTNKAGKWLKMAENPGKTEGMRWCPQDFLEHPFSTIEFGDFPARIDCRYRYCLEFLDVAKPDPAVSSIGNHESLESPGPHLMGIVIESQNGYPSEFLVLSRMMKGFVCVIVSVVLMPFYPMYSLWV